MKIDMTRNQIRFDPQIPESLKNNSEPITFEHTLIGISEDCRLSVTLDPRREKLSVKFKGHEPKIQLLSSSHKIEQNTK